MSGENPPQPPSNDDEIIDAEFENKVPENANSNPESYEGDAKYQVPEAPKISAEDAERIKRLREDLGWRHKKETGPVDAEFEDKKEDAAETNKSSEGQDPKKPEARNGSGPKPEKKPWKEQSSKEKKATLTRAGINSVGIAGVGVAATWGAGALISGIGWGPVLTNPAAIGISAGGGFAWAPPLEFGLIMAISLYIELRKNGKALVEDVLSAVNIFGGKVSLGGGGGDHGAKKKPAAAASHAPAAGGGHGGGH